MKSTLLILLVNSSHAAQLHVAVASNFALTLQHLAVGFKQQNGHDLVISSGSTGQLFAQIKQGAPFDVYMAADVQRPQRLFDQGLASEPQVYARGQLVLLVNELDCQSTLNSNKLKHLAIANPDLAPYGLAAKQYLQNNKLWEPLSEQLVVGENVSQAMHMVSSGNATAGLVARSTLVNYELKDNQCILLIPEEYHEPIEQAMVLLNGLEKSKLFDAFINYLNSEQAINIMIKNGYIVSDQ